MRSTDTKGICSNQQASIFFSFYVIFCLVIVIFCQATAGATDLKPNVDPFTVRLFQHPNYVGQSLDVTIHPDQIYVFINNFPSYIDNQGSSIAVGESVGAILFAEPNFVGKDENLASTESCAEKLNSHRSESWAHFAGSSPEIARQQHDPDWYEVVFNPAEWFGNGASSSGIGDRASSMIVYRKNAVQGFVGAEFVNDDRNLELTRLFDGGTCEFSRWFYPLPLPATSACVDLVPGANEKALIFHGNYQGKPVSARLFSQPGCKGEFILFPDPVLDVRNIRLNQYGWEDKARSMSLFIDSKIKVGGAVSMKDMPSGWTEENSRRSGDAFLQLRWDKDDPGACRAACEADVRCRSYSHVGTKAVVDSMARSKVVDVVTAVKMESYDSNEHIDSSKAIQALCELFATVADRTFLKDGVSGVKSFSGMNKHAFVGPRAGGSAIKVCVPALGNQCGKPVADFYCKQQGFFAAESYTENAKKEFASIVCTNTVRVEQQETTAGSPALVGAKSPGAEDRCSEYARTAVQQQQENLDRHCGRQGPEWSLDYSAHYGWCRTVSMQETKAGTQLRAEALEKCTMSVQQPETEAVDPAAAPGNVAAQGGNLEDRCAGYARTAVQQQQENLDRHCGQMGPEWNLDYNAHYGWCRAVPAQFAEAGTRLRAEALQGCPAGDQARPTADENRCASYASRAVQQQQENITKNCGQTGPEWSPDYNAHYSWCLGVPAQFAEAGTLLRINALKKCTGNSP